MNITVFACDDNVFINRECVSGLTFKIAAMWDKCALLPVICAIFRLYRDSHINFSRIECLLPTSPAT